MKSTLLVLFSLLIGFCESWAQTDVKPVLLQRYGVQEGLPGRTIWSIEASNDGLIWLSTEYGLLRWDGFRFESFTDRNRVEQQQMVIKGVGHLQKAWEDKFIICPPLVEDSLEWFDPVTFANGSLSFREMEGAFQDYYIGSAGDVWILTTEADRWNIYRQATTTEALLVHTFRAPQSPCADLPLKLLIDADDQPFIFSPCSGLIFKKSDDELVSVFKGAPVRHLRGLIFHCDRNNRFWFSANNESPLFKGQNSNQWSIERSIKENETISELYEDKNGNLIFTETDANYSHRMLLLKADGTWINLSSVLKEENRRIDIWGNDFTESFHLASAGGLYTFQLPEDPVDSKIKKFLFRNLPRGQFGVVMRGFVEAPDGRIFVAQEGRDSSLLVLHPNDSLSVLPILYTDGSPVPYTGCMANMHLANNVLTLFSCQQDANGQIHQYHLINERWKTITIPEERTFARLVVADNTGGYYFFCYNKNTKGQSIYYLPPRGEHLVSLKNNLSPEQQRANIFQCARWQGDSILWIGGSRGLIKFNANERQFSPFATNALGTNSIHDLCLRGEILLVSTAQEGVLEFNPDGHSVKPWRYPSGVPIVLSNQSIAFLRGVDDTQFLVGTYNGLNLVNVENETVQVFDQRHGLNSHEFNRHSVFKAQDATWYVGGINGFNSFRIDDLSSGKSPPIPQVSSFFYLPTDATKEYRKFTTANQDRFEISARHLYCGFNLFQPFFTDPSELVFEIDLISKGDTTHAVSEQSEVRFTRLSPGDYQLRYRAMTDQGIYSPYGSVQLKVSALWYQKPWFIGSIVSIIAVLIYFFNWRRLRRRVAKEAQLQLQQESTQKRIAELEMELLRSQLNPHFVFNALSAIQFYITTQETELANDYLTEFAKLIRLFLESSKSPVYRIEREIELIRYYTRLEAIRFEGRFTVNLEVDPNLDTLGIEIPTSLVQPFVENAINHGLLLRESGGALTIRFFEEAEVVLIQIIDNGIGRKASQKQQLGKRRHRSRATEILNERVRFINSIEHYAITVTTDDLLPDTAYPGTKVTIRIREL